MTEEKFREIILNSNSSYKFLRAGQGYWLGVNEKGEDEFYYIPTMGKKYKENCINYLKQHSNNIRKGFFLEGVVFKKEEYNELLQLGCDAMEQKIRELSQ